MNTAIGEIMERVSVGVALLAAVLLALAGCGQEAERGHDDPTPHALNPEVDIRTGTFYPG